MPFPLLLGETCPKKNTVTQPDIPSTLSPLQSSCLPHKIPHAAHSTRAVMTLWDVFPHLHMTHQKLLQRSLQFVAFPTNIPGPQLEISNNPLSLLVLAELSLAVLSSPFSLEDKQQLNLHKCLCFPGFVHKSASFHFSESLSALHLAHKFLAINPSPCQGRVPSLPCFTLLIPQLGKSLQSMRHFQW